MSQSPTCTGVMLMHLHLRWHLKTGVGENMTDGTLRLWNPPETPLSIHLKADYTLIRGRQHAGPGGADE